MIISPEDLIKLGLAILVGGLIGAEREYRDKAAGFRTIIFICVGATLFTILSTRIAGPNNDPARIAANIVSGVGFLGAGAIMRGEGRVMGLTTAATIWIAAALGMGIGGGHYVTVSAAALGVLIVLWLFPNVEHLIDNIRDHRTYEVICPLVPEKFEEIEALFEDCGLHVRSRRRLKSGDTMLCTWEIAGKPKEHAAVAEKLFAHPDVMEFRI
ncbi:MAG: MgtC/SapB family protein [Anaerolineae bacterium]|nr:MgtC/SapB family protein [Anaerolineae bacterium]